MGEFEFLRPGWLLLGPVGIAAIVWLWRRSSGTSTWRRYGDAQLLDRVLVPLGGSGWQGWALLSLGVALAAVALAGPSWERALTSSLRPAHTRVVVLDLSRSMDAQDATPSRLGVAIDKVREILERSQGLQVGMVVFAGAAFPLAPLTTDARTLIHYLDILETSVIPVQGSRPDLGLETAGEILRKGGALTGEVILISDGYRGHRVYDSAVTLFAAGFPVSVIGVGTEKGTTIPALGGIPLRDLAGDIVVVPTYFAQLEEIARAGGGRFSRATDDNDDLDRVLMAPELWENSVDDPDRRLSVPRDGGPWVVLLLIPLAAFAFRRGWLLVVPLAVSLSMVPAPVEAAWYDWLRGADYRAKQALLAGDAEKAARIANDPLLAGAAYYRLGEYGLAAAAFAQSASAIGYYNQGNALAKLGRLREAVAVYDQALALDPGLADARLNQAALLEFIAEEPNSKRETDHEKSERESRDRESAASFESPGPSPGSSASAEPSDAPEPANETVTRRDERAQTAPEENADASLSPTSAARYSGPAFGGPLREHGSGDHEWTPGEMEALLDRVPDDPTSLLRQRLRYEFEQSRWTRVQNTDAW